MTARTRSWLLAVGTLLALILLGLALRPLRVPGFAEAVPFAPPVYHGVLEAYSTDGLDFRVQAEPLRFPAETQHQAIARDGGRLLIFFDGHDEQTKLLDLDSGALTVLALGGDCGVTTLCVDPVWTRLDTGWHRLYYSVAPRGEDPALGQAPTEIHSARSEDGRRWEVERGVRMVGRSIVDPDVVALPEGGFRMYFTSLLDERGRPLENGLPAVFSARSALGLEFVREPGVRLADASASATVLLPDGRVRLYFHPFEGGIASAISSDGLNFEREPGLRLPADPLPGTRWVGSASPAVVQLEDGRAWMTINAALEPPFPWNLWAVLRYRHRHEPETPPEPPPPAR
jgi:hypothetical protein